jgi:hypothetical protein
MSHITIIAFEFNVSDSGDKTFKVTRRRGLTRENPPTEVLHDSHFYDDARRAALRAITQARKDQ